MRRFINGIRRRQTAESSLLRRPRINSSLSFLRVVVGELLTGPLQRDDADTFIIAKTPNSNEITIGQLKGPNRGKLYARIKKNDNIGYYKIGDVTSVKIEIDRKEDRELNYYFNILSDAEEKVDIAREVHKKAQIAIREYDRLAIISNKSSEETKELLELISR
ncbi:MAG: hypothetical protein QM698_08640 [Micropepsaceae bacterium]